MDEHYAPQPVAGWYWLGSIASLIFMLIGCAVYGTHAYTDPATLPLDQRAMFEAEPEWVTMMLGVASVLGTAGAILLLMRRRPAVPLLLASLIVTLIWFGGLLGTPQLRDLFSTTEIAVLLVVMATSWTIYGFARHSRQRGWLR